uniref:multidrug ABC transporter n=1 Tax=Eubacterium cellulosolvens TaxID=29322 RepID=UPI000489BFF8|nr:multidrug ABC transporter [[Eubacterium] cellulosolvens]
MNTSMIPYILIYLAGVFFSSLSQILLKKEANKEHGSFLQEYLNPRVIVAYGIFFGCTFLTMLAYKGIPMNWGPVLETAGYIFVTVLGVTILKEKITWKKFLALCVILAGILLYAL